MNSSSNPASLATSTEPFQAPLPIVLANALWFISLVVALACALLATLVQQWSRDYVRDIKTRDTLDGNTVSRALNHVYIRMGVDRWGMDGVVNLIVALVHLAVILFAAGLLLFLFPINGIVSWCTMSALSIFGLVYLIAGVLPIFDASCPYRTPLTYPLNLIYAILRRLYYRCLWPLVFKMRRKSVSRWVLRHYRTLNAGWFASRSATVDLRNNLAHRADHHREPDAVNWICQSIVASYRAVSSSLVHARRARKLCSKTFTWIWRHVVTLSLFKIYTSSTKRRIRRDIRGFISVPRFFFIWEHTRRQMLFGDDTSLKILLLSTLDILRSMKDDARSTAVYHLLHDDDVRSRLHQSLEESVSDARAATFKMVYVLMHEYYSKQEMWVARGDDGIHKSRIKALIWTLLTYKHLDNSPVIRTDAAFVQPTMLSLFHLRWFLLLRTRQVESSMKSEFNLPGFLSLYFSEGCFSEWPRWYLFHDHHMLEHPRPLLLLLNSRSYDPLRSYSPLHLRADGEDDIRSCLTPLHDDACCRRIDGPLEHVAACTVLTMIAQLVRAPDDEREKLLEDHLREYSRFWDHGLLFTEWETTFEVDARSYRSAPSDEFLAVLQDAGVGEWLRPGGDSAYLPPLDTPLGLFLSTSVTGYIGWPKITFADMLCTLTGHVDMTSLRSDLPESYQWSLHTPGIPVFFGWERERRSQPAYLDEDIYHRESAEVSITKSPRRVGSFDLEQTAIDTVVGISSQPSGLREITNRRPGARYGVDVNHGHGNDIAVSSKQLASAEARELDNAQVQEPGPFEPNDRDSASAQTSAVNAADAPVVRADTAQHETSTPCLATSDAEHYEVGPRRYRLRAKEYA